jgi:hypothetical protein
MLQKHACLWNKNSTRGGTTAGLEKLHIKSM